ncbi:MAG: 30S ribosomal protein S20 [Bacteroidaceae bacterium]|nr:30S ribosomal protein S20 [Bacteroidaceae bacterium]
MANHKSSLKRIRQTERKNLLNRYYGKNMRSAVRSLRAVTNKEEALAKFPLVQKMLDRMAKRGLIHKNKAANLKSGLCARIAKLA